MIGSMPVLRRLPAPAYWSRYDVLVGGVRVGLVEKHGGMSPWYAILPSGLRAGPPALTKGEAVAMLFDLPEGDPGSGSIG